MTSFRGIRSVLANVLLVCLVPITTMASTATADDLEFLGDETHLAPLGREIVRLAAEAKGTVGVAAIHLESGQGLFLNGDDRFPMASTYKVPIAVEILAQVDTGERSLDELVAVRPEDIVNTHGAIRDFLHPGGSQLTIRDLIELMLRISDNIATDLLLEEAGGGERVTTRMKVLGAAGIRVDRSTRQIIGNWLGRTTSAENPWIPSEEFDRLVDPTRLAELSADDEAQLNLAFNADPQDTASPRAMAGLLRGIWNRALLSDESSELLIDVMERCDTGPLRLRGALPEGTVVAHKTGTIGQTTNDVGVIYLPNDGGHVVTVVYIKESQLESNEAMEPVIAQIARAIHDFFVFRATEG